MALLLSTNKRMGIKVFKKNFNLGVKFTKHHPIYISSKGNKIPENNKTTVGMP